MTSAADEDETQLLYPDQREGRLNVTFKSSRRIDSGPSGSSGKYLGLTGDTKLNNQRSPERVLNCGTLWTPGHFFLHHTLFYVAENMFMLEMYISINNALYICEMFPSNFRDKSKNRADD